nr:uncharacterized protein LOC129387066 [Dermacentor andersoni]
MEAHNYLTSGWVQQPCLKVLSDGRVVIVCQVRHSQSVNDKPLTPWLVIKEDGEVQAAHCTCKAGLGEACSLIAAVRAERPHGPQVWTIPQALWTSRNDAGALWGTSPNAYLLYSERKDLNEVG